MQIHPLSFYLAFHWPSPTLLPCVSQGTRAPSSGSHAMPMLSRIHVCPGFWLYIGKFPSSWGHGFAECLEKPQAPLKSYWSLLHKGNRMGLKPLWGDPTLVRPGTGVPLCWHLLPQTIWICFLPSGPFCCQEDVHKQTEKGHARRCQWGTQKKVPTLAITKARLLIGIEAESKHSPQSFQGHSCFGSEKLSVSVMDNGNSSMLAY